MPSESTLSFLMVVTNTDRFENLSRCIDSIKNQSRKVNQVVIVLNGKLSKKIIGELLKFKKNFHNVSFVESHKKLNLGPALNLGLSYSKTAWVLRIDPDDLNLLERVAQVKKDVAKYKFDLGVYTALELRNNKLINANKFSGKDLIESFKIINPIFHSSVVINKRALLSVGGYRDIKYAEDYDLWLRFILTKRSIRTFNTPVVIFNASNIYKRRKDLSSIRSEFEIFYIKRKIYKNNLVNIFILLFRIFYKFLPIFVMKRIYTNFISRKII